MFKFTIILCFVLFASTAHSAFLSDALEAVQEKTGQAINATIAEVEERFNATEERAREIAEGLVNKASELKQELKDEVDSILETAVNEIDAYLAKAAGVDVSECTRWAAHLRATANAIVANVTKCLTDKVETGTGYVRNMFGMTTEVLRNLTAISEEAYHCCDNVNSISTAAIAVVCTNMAGAKAAWISAKVIPGMVINFTKLNFMLVTLSPTLTYCSAKNGMITLYNESSNAVQNTRNCVQEKIDAAKSATTPAIIYNTEQNEE